MDLAAADGKEITLKPCPFCGKEPKKRVSRFGVEKFDRYGIVCFDCGICIGWFEDEEEAAQKWNRRDGVDTE